MQMLLFGLMGAVLMALFLGLGVMIRGGAANARFGNKLMVARVAFQGLAVALLGLMFLFSKHSS